MKNSLLWGVALSVFVVGCANTLPESKYVAFSNLGGGLQKCLDSGDINQRLYDDGKAAFIYLINTWKYDEQRLSSMMSDVYLNENTDPQFCQHVSYAAHQLVSTVSQNLRKEKETQRALESINRTLNKTAESMKKNTPSTTYTNCTDDMLGGVDCTSTTY